MSEPPYSPTDTTTATDRWLSPVEALGRFAPGERLQLEVQDEAHETTRFGFRVGALGLLIGERVACEVVPPASIARIPNTAAWLRGVTNLRGSLVPVFDLEVLFGSAPDAPDNAADARERKMILVMGRGERAAGLLIDGYPRAVRGATPLAELPPLPDALEAHVGAGYIHEGSAWIEFRHEAFLEALARRVAV